MKTKLLFVFALIVAVAAVWFFRNHGEVKPTIQIEDPNIDSEVTNIEAGQTNEEGELEYQLNADSMKHNTETNNDEISGLNMDWTPAKDKNYMLTSGTASINQQTGEMQLTNGFKLVGNATDDTTKIMISGSELTGNTKDRIVKSNQPVEVIQGDNHFKATSMNANLATGDYEFENIDISFLPTERQDKALF